MIFTCFQHQGFAKDSDVLQSSLSIKELRNFRRKQLKKNQTNIFQTRAEYFFAGMEAHWGEGGGRILLRDNTDGRADLLKHIEFPCVLSWDPNWTALHTRIQVTIYILTSDSSEVLLPASRGVNVVRSNTSEPFGDIWTPPPVSGLITVQPNWKANRSPNSH